MRPIIKIAKNELRNLFYSPVAWFLAITFLVMCAYFYTGVMYAWSKQTQFILKSVPDLAYRATEPITANFFSDPKQGFFANILSNIYLFIPLLTMSIINRESNGGTIRLLYSSPVRLSHIVFGKYLALMIYNLILVVVMGIFVISGFFNIKSMDAGPVLTAVAGIYLFLCALTAIGFFMSSLTAYPIVSAIASFTVLFILTIIGGLWQEYDFVRDLTYFLSVKSRTEKMIVGLIRSKDIIYYLVIIGMFVIFTLIKLRSGREAKPWYVRAIRYAAVSVIALLVGYISSRPALIGYYDVTRRKVNTINRVTQKVLQHFGDSALKVTFYVNLFDLSSGAAGLPAVRNYYLDIWEPYTRFKPDIQFDFKYYYAALPGDSALYRQFPNKTLKQIAGIVTRAHQLDSAAFRPVEELQKTIDLASENYRAAMQVTYQGRSAFIHFLPSQTGFDFEESSTEPNIIAALKRVLGEKMPRLAFVVGELERNIYKKGEREFWLHTIATGKLNDWGTRGSLNNLGFDIDTLNLSFQDIPPDITALVLADPKVDLSPVVLNKIHNYIAGGGNMLIFGEPGKQNVLNPVIRPLGMQLANGQLVQSGADDLPDNIGFYLTPAYLDLANEHWSLYIKNLIRYKIRIDTFPTKIFGAAVVLHKEDNGFKVAPLLVTLPRNIWLKAGKVVTDSLPPVFNSAEGDIKENAFPVAFQLSRQRPSGEQRIIICGDADIAGNLRLISDCVRSFYSWLDDNKFPVYTLVPYAKDNILLLSPAGASAQKIIYLWVLPGALLFLGTGLLIRRKRR